MKKLFIIFGLATVLIGFQNCAPTMHFDPAEGSTEVYGKAAISSEVIPSQTSGQEVVVDENHGDVVGVVTHEEDHSAQQAEQQQQQQQQQEEQHQTQTVEQPIVAEHQEEQQQQTQQQEQQQQQTQQDQQTQSSNEQTAVVACNVEKVTVKFKDPFLFIGEYVSDKKNSDHVDVKKIIVDLASGEADLYNPKKLKRSCTMNAEQLAELKTFACECIADASAPNCDNYSKKLSQELRKELKRMDDCTKVEGQDEGKAQSSDMQADSHGKSVAKK